MRIPSFNMSRGHRWTWPNSFRPERSRAKRCVAATASARSIGPRSKRPSRGGTQRLEALQRIRIPANQPDQRDCLFVGLAEALLPAFQRSRVDSELEGEDLPRHLKRFARFSEDLGVHGRKRDGLDPMRTERDPPFAMGAHRLHAPHELTIQA